MMQWPPDFKAEIERRLRNRNKLIEDPQIRAGLMVYYANNPIDWINDYCITFDPRAMKPNPRLMPFMLFPRQVDFIYFLLDCFHDKENGLVEKCRDVGATWLCCCFSVWLWLFHPGTVIGWGSNKEANVDKKGDPKAIFTKIRQLLDNLPRWMLPAGYSTAYNALFLRIVNPVNDCAITGEAGENMGRSGRTSIYFKDESAHYEHPEQVEAALGDNTDVQIDISSVNGSANVFYRRRMAGEEWVRDRPSTPERTRVFIFDWRDHPGKSQEWHDKRERKAEAEGMLHIFRQEVERDYAGSIDRVIINPEWARATIDAHIKLGFGDGNERIAGQDVADGGSDKNALIIRRGVITRFADHWTGDAGAAATRAVPECVPFGVRELYYDSVGVGVGFKTEINHMKALPTFPKNMQVMPWNGGGSVMDPTEHVIPGDDNSPLNEDQYLNMKAQGWFRMRTRCYKTYQAVKHGKYYDPSELISIDSTLPLAHQLVMELSQAVHKQGAKGKTVVDKKPDGARSPNLADGAVICYNPNREVSIFDSMRGD